MWPVNSALLLVFSTDADEFGFSSAWPSGEALRAWRRRRTSNSRASFTFWSWTRRISWLRSRSGDAGDDEWLFGPLLVDGEISASLGSDEGDASWSWSGRWSPYSWLWISAYGKSGSRICGLCLEIERFVFLLVPFSADTSWESATKDAAARSRSSSKLAKWRWKSV